MTVVMMTRVRESGSVLFLASHHFQDDITRDIGVEELLGSYRQFEDHYVSFGHDRELGASPVATFVSLAEGYGRLPECAWAFLHHEGGFQRLSSSIVPPWYVTLAIAAINLRMTYHLFALSSSFLGQFPVRTA